MNNVPTIIKDNKFAVIDLETTGLSWKGSKGKPDEIIQVAIAQVDHGTARFRLSCNVKPGVPISPGAMNVHGITMRQLEFSPRFWEIAKDVRDFIGDRCLLGYNILRFDSKFLDRQFRESAIHAPFPNMLDVYVWAKRHNNGQGRNSLGIAAARHGVKVKDRHDAFGDIRATWGLFVKLARLHPELGGRSLSEVLEHQSELT